MHSVCILIHVSMYLYSYLSTHGMSGLAARGDWEQFEVRMKMTIKWTQIYTLMPWSSEFGDAIGDRDRVNSEMHWEGMIERSWGCNWRPRLNELRDALGGRDRVSLEMQLDTECERTERCTARPWSSKFGHALGGRDRVSSEMHSELWLSEFRDAHAAGYDRGRLEEYLEVVDLEAVD